MILIGICGYKGSGKDSLARMLSNHLGAGASVIRAFADPIREELCEAFDLKDSAILTKREGKDTPNPALNIYGCRDHEFRSLVLSNFDKPLLSPRQAMQWWGTEYRRKHSGEDYWTRKMVEYLTDYGATCRFAIIPDLRFVSEAALVTACRGYMVRVVRSRPGDDAHQSEHEHRVINPDYIVMNQGSLSELETKAEHLSYSLLREMRTVPVV